MKKIYRFSILFIAFIMIFQFISSAFCIKTFCLEEESEFFEVNENYCEYYKKYHEAEKTDDEIKIMAYDYNRISDNQFSTGYYEGKENILILNDISGSVEYNINIEKAGIYSIYISYCSVPSDLSDIEISVSVDGNIPYDTAGRIILSRTWQGNEHSYDNYGNQTLSPQTEKIMWKTSYLNDSDGLFSEPLIFYFEKGKHTVIFSSQKAYFALEYFILKNPKPLQSYSEYAQNFIDSESMSENVLIRIEGEDNLYTSDPVLCDTYDRNDCMCSPSDPVKRVFNTFGNELWKKSFQSAVWEIEIDKSGWYTTGIKYKQDEMRGVYTNRRIYIDGKVPFSEFDNVSFAYSPGWELAVMDDFPIYLEKGTHTITLEAVPGDTGIALCSLDSIINELNEYYRKIVMITGVNPDKYTDYYVHEKIPELTEKFSEISLQLKEIQNNIENLSGYRGSEASQLERISVILDKCIEKPLKIQNYIPQLKDSISSVSSWSRTFREQPLEIDYIEIASSDMEFSEIKGGFFKSLVFMLQNFIGSFFSNYSVLSESENKDTLEVWVCLGRDQTQIIKELADLYFTPEYKINVNINLVQGTVLEACISGSSPDAALFLGGDFPVNLAVRDLTVCLSDFDDYESISQRFHESADIQYTYNNGVYALPVSQSWAMMFYRKDILYELGYTSPPETWSDLTDMLPSMQRNYMSCGLVLPSSNIAPSTESGHTYAALLMQNGLSYYNNDMTAAFDNTESLQLFEFWTDLYSEYGLEQSYDPFSRFRTGEYPIVIQDYTFANQLEYSAPEIKGLWDFTCIPGSINKNGNISHAVNSSGSGAVIFKDSDNTDEAWQFLKWFTSDEIQTEYSRRTEGVLGRLERFTPANTYALKNSSWSGNELEKIMLQRNELNEIPVLPYSYAVTRNVMNAFRETVNNKSNSYSTMIIYNNDINYEISRKKNNLGGYSN